MAIKYYIVDIVTALFNIERPHQGLVRRYEMKICRAEQEISS